MRAGVRWTNLSRRQIAARITELGTPVSRHVVSQLLLAIPLWLLYEFGILMGRFFVPPVTEEEEAAEQAASR